MFQVTKQNIKKNGHKEHPESEQQFVDISQSVVKCLVWTHSTHVVENGMATA